VLEWSSAQRVVGPSSSMSDYLQQLIKDFKSKDFKNFAGYVYTTLQREIDAATNNKQKNKYILIRKQILRYIVTNEKTITKELLNKK
jgi:hypothetical protein